MKTLTTFYSKNPSYLKVGSDKVAAKTGLKVATVNKFKTTPEYKAMKNQYMEIVKNRKATKTNA
jgi:hypothetical protein